MVALAPPTQPPDSGDDSTVYPVTGEPLLNAGAHETVTDALPETPRTAVGALGAFIGTTPLEGDDAALCPARLVATTVNV
jgi:hypothetical protein